MKSGRIEIEILNETYHELKGWWWESYGNGGGFWHRTPKTPTHKRSQMSSCVCGGRLIPRLDTDLNLAVAEASKEFLMWHFYGHERERNRFVVLCWRTKEDESICKGSGSTLNEAILKALIAKVQSEKAG